MPQLKIDITARRKRIFDAICMKNDITMDQLLEPQLAAIDVAHGGIDLTDSIEDQDATVAKLERKATKEKSDRDARAAAQKAAEAAQNAASPGA